jgi:hypothetical protein
LPHNQSFKPAYYWDNRMSNGSLMSVSVQNTGLDQVHIQANRDYYTTVTSFNGTSGVGEGPLGSRPATCTPGVGYWAIDDGEWNSLNPGPDGRLYKCTAPNTWTLYYTPFTYPHPWAGGVQTTVPNAPSQLMVQ